MISTNCLSSQQQCSLADRWNNCQVTVACSMSFKCSEDDVSYHRKLWYCLLTTRTRKIWFFANVMVLVLLYQSSPEEGVRNWNILDYWFLCVQRKGWQTFNHTIACNPCCTAWAIWRGSEKEMEMNGETRWTTLSHGHGTITMMPYKRVIKASLDTISPWKRSEHVQ